MAKTTLEIICRPIAEISEWDDFVSKSPQATIFQSSQYLKIAADIFQRSVDVIAVLEKNQIVGGAVILPQAKFRLNYSTAPFFLPYNGILIDNNRKFKHPSHKISFSEKIITEILDYVTRNFHFLNWHLSPRLTDIRPFIWADWSSSPDYSVVFKLDSDPLSFDCLEKAQKRKFRQWDQRESEIVVSESMEVLAEMLAQSYQKHASSTPLSSEQYIKFTTKLAAAGIGKLYLLQDGQNKYAAVFCIEDEKEVYFLFSGRNFNTDSSGGELFLIFSLLMSYQKKGYKKVDLLGAMIPSIAKSKFELGGQLERSEKVSYYRNSLLQLASTLITKKNTRSRKIRST